jgi:protein O-GlcNAc transferase
MVCSVNLTGKENHTMRKPQIPSPTQPFKKQVIRPDPEMAKVFQQGLAFHQQGQLVQAKASYEQVLSKQPKNFDALHLLGVVAAQTENPALAVALIGKALEINSRSAAAFSNLGSALKELKQLDDALASYDKAIALKPDHAEAFNNRGIVLQELKRLGDALASYDKAIALKPDKAEPFNYRGTVLQELKRLGDAVASYDQAIALKPDYAEAFYNRGTALKELAQLDGAVASYDRAIALKPDDADSFNNRGNALQKLKRLDDALASYDRAIALKPDYVEALNNRGTVLQALKRLDDALGSYDQAIELKPDDAEAFNNRGTVLQELKRLDDALVCYDKAIALNPGYKFLLGIKLHTQMHLCDWSNLTSQLEMLEESIEKDQMVTPSFPLLGLVDKPEVQWKASRIYANEKHPELGFLGGIKSRPADGKIRIGYYSADFHNHATSFLMAGLFESHDSQKFELYGFSFGPDKQDGMRHRVASAFDHFMDVNLRTDRDVAQISRDLGIDIAVDLKGFTQDARMGIFAEQCAPIQINFLGYPGTLAAPYFDYIVADKTVISQESQSYFTEKIVYLPHSYQVNDSKREISPMRFTRQALGLPENGFVFCCFNNNYKILPETFDVWMRLLKAVHTSVLWLLEDNPTAAKNLRKEAENRGVDSARLIFAPRMQLADHLARHRVADLFIDTLPCNAHTTASDALWAGLPVLTQMGQSFAARVSASLLQAMDLPELITKTKEEYEARAIELASDPVLLAEIKNKVAQNRQTSPLFNSQLYARHLEAAYSEIYRRHLNGEKPDHIDVQALMSCSS